MEHTITATDLGIDLPSKQESELFKWLLACLLFGKPIQQEVARQAYYVITEAGITSAEILADRSWDDLVGLLDQGHYVRYDFSTATKLLDVSKSVVSQYGSVSALVEGSADAHQLEERLKAFK